ncbi:hypothetical protein DPMN_019172 [Dreissena polymorpha]|uniref:Uncharacterized protein n=1 Tax=Dreissena polymorpha TaxID=45954 RepID=A0A9D4NEJ1_DREPO|nr:hypothetical protein DPMN_019172 [Dreissena polymorpha]
MKFHVQILKNAPPTGGHVFQATGTTFELIVQNIIGTNLLTKFHDDRTINMASKVLTRKNATPPWRPYIIGTNLLTKFYDDQAINMASRVLTRRITTTGEAWYGLGLGFRLVLGVGLGFGLA